MRRAIVRGYDKEWILDFPESYPAILGQWLDRIFSEFQPPNSRIPVQFTITIQ